MEHFRLDYFPFLLKASLEGGVLILLVLFVQRLLGRRLDARWRSALWLLVMIRLGMPWAVPSRVSLFNLANVPELKVLWGGIRGGAGPFNSNGREIHGDPVPGREEAGFGVKASHPGPVWGARVSWVFRAWSVGALFFSGILLAAHFRLSKKLGPCRQLRETRMVNLLEQCKSEMGVKGKLALFEAPGVNSPCILGFIRPRLLLPTGFTRRFSMDETRFIFLHELSHIKRRDILTGWMASWLQVVHWFNPLVWLASYRMRLDRELACDAMALSHARHDENEKYGQTVIKLLEHFGRAAWVPSLAGAIESTNQMKERIRMIAKFKKPQRGLPIAALLFCGLGIMTLTDAQPVAQSGADLVGTWILIGRPGQIGAVPAVGGRVKTLTDGHWSVLQTAPGTGETLFRHGGTWTLKNGEYFETVEYAGKNTSQLVGKTSKFHLALGDALTLDGIGNPWKEVWKRVEPNATPPREKDPAPFQGTWNGYEIAGHQPGTATLRIDGTKFEFHGADTNEWYKATFTAYETTPTQLVIRITDCGFAEYVGKTAYAICQTKDGSLTIGGNEPGNPTVPAGFNAPGVREFVFGRE